VITVPNGESAARCDESFRRAFEVRNRPVPDWVAEHQAHPYPTLETVVRDIGTARHPRITTHFAESTRVRAAIRTAAARSRGLWAATNLAAGLLVPVLPTPAKAHSYRFVVLAELE
jgi:hypothetical protein